MVNTVRQSLNRRWSHVKNKLSIEAPTTVPTTTPPNPSPAHSTATGGQSDPSNATWPTAEYKLANPLLDFGLLKIPADDYTWFNNVNLAIRDLMNGPNYDASHNYQHARRVVANGKNILEHEVKHHEWARKLDPMVIYLGCLVYSVGSTKFRTIGEDREQDAIVDEFLKEHDCPKPLRREVAYLVCRVNMPGEVNTEQESAGFAEEYPAFQIIQDAVWLDALGRVGVARLFSDGVEEHKLKANACQVIEGQLSRVPGLMKTKTGKKLAGERYHWMVHEFLYGYEDETEALGV